MFVILGLIVALVAVTVWRAVVREKATLNTYPPTGEIVMVDGVPVHVQVMGSGPDLVLIHGASGNLRDFTYGFSERLTDKYRVIAFDRAGMGWSGRLPSCDGAWNATAETPHQQAALLQGAADQIGVQSPIVLGHSYGGAVALAWGLARPKDTAAMVLVAGAAEPWPGGLGLFYGICSSALGGALLVPLITAFTPRKAVDDSVTAIFAPQNAPDGYADHVGPGLTLRRHSMRANAQQVNGLLPHIIEMQTKYHTLSMPIEIVHGDADTIVPAHVHAEVLINDVPEGALTILPGMGHMPQHSAPQAVVDAIERAASRAGLR